MLRYLKNMMQLLLSPSRGWEDISADSTETQELLERGYYPLLGAVAISCFMKFLWIKDITLAGVLTQAVLTFGTFFACYFLVRFILDLFAGNLVYGEVSEKKLDNISIYCLSVLAFFILIENCIPANLTLLKFLPLFVAMIAYKSGRYLGVPSEDDFRYGLIAVVATVVVPMALYSGIMLLSL